MIIISWQCVLVLLANHLLPSPNEYSSSVANYSAGAALRQI